jgi:hypothetical protein
VSEESRDRRAEDTVADDYAMTFLSELDEVLSIVEEIQGVRENAFGHAVRKDEHVRDFRRVLFRLHVLLATWEQEADAGG